MSLFFVERLLSEVIAVGGIFAPLLKYVPPRPLSFFSLLLSFSSPGVGGFRVVGLFLVVGLNAWTLY